MSLFKNWTTSAMTDWGNDGDRFVEELTTYSRAIAKNPKKRPDMVNLKKSFKEMVRDVDEETLLDNIKLLKRTVTSKQDLLDVVNTPSMNDVKTVLHKQVKDQNVIKVAVLVRTASITRRKSFFRIHTRNTLEHQTTGTVTSVLGLGCERY